MRITIKYVCKYCKKEYSNTNATTLLRKHLINDHKIDFGEKKIKKKMVNQLSIKKTNLNR